MKFSIVTPSYNQKNFIEDTIRSVLAQTYQDLEYIIIDGGSTDGTGEVLQHYSANIDTIIIEPDEGQADAINKGFRHASGDIFAYLNSDDYYLSDTLEIVAKVFSDNPEIDVIYGDCVFTDENGQFLRYFSEIWEYYPKKLLNHSNFIMQPSTFWRRSVFEKYGPFDKTLHFGFDWALWCEFTANNCRFLRLNEVLSANRVYGETKTTSGGELRLEELKKINRRYKTTLLNHAYFTFSFAELMKKRNKSPVDYFRQALFFVLSYKNIVFHLLHAREKIINGVYPHSGFVRKQARIRLPFYPACSKIMLAMTTPGFSGQSVAITINNGQTTAYEFNDGVLELELDVSPPSTDININMEFAHEYRRPASMLDVLKRFYQSPRVAAEITRLELQ